jgi:hypothetical protein
MRGKLRGCDAKKLSGSDIGENEVSIWELCNLTTGFNPPRGVEQWIAAEATTTRSRSA